MAVCRYAQSLCLRKVEVLLVGYSYGSMITSSCLHEDENHDNADNGVVAAVAISYPYTFIDFLTLFNRNVLKKTVDASKPILFIMGKFLFIYVVLLGGVNIL